MGLFSRIMDKLRGHSQDAGGPQASAGGATPSSPAQQTQFGTSHGQQSSGGAASPQPQTVDVDAVMTQLASRKGGGGNWRTSIVDTLKLLDLDSSLEARKELAQELGVSAGAPGSAEQNIALQKALMRRIAENGGKVPDDLKD